MKSTGVLLLYTLICCIVIGTIAAISIHMTDTHPSKPGKIALPEDVGAAKIGDTMVVVDHGDLLDIEFYDGKELKPNEQLLILQGN